VSSVVFVFCRSPTKVTPRPKKRKMPSAFLFLLERFLAVPPPWRPRNQRRRNKLGVLPKIPSGDSPCFPFALLVELLAPGQLVLNLDRVLRSRYRLKYPRFGNLRSAQLAVTRTGVWSYTDSLALPSLLGNCLAIRSGSYTSPSPITGAAKFPSFEPPYLLASWHSCRLDPKASGPSA